MITLELERYAYCPTETMGRLYAPGLTLQALELPWQNNQPYISCIPEGIYPLTRRTSSKHGRHWLVNDVPGRSMILIHVANYTRQLEGCIAIGTGRMFSLEEGAQMVTNSADAMELLNKTLAGFDDIRLFVRPYRIH